MSKIRFAGLTRVSTEKQEQEGESLNTQKKQIEKAVCQLGGTVVAWYGGQEHATPGCEKKEINRLLGDARKKPKLFDAVMVTDADRWSRDNQGSQAGLDVFKNHEIRFFIQTTEHDLFDEDDCLYLSFSAVIGQYAAKKTKRKSLENRIARAKEGVPTCGKLPFGRTFDTKTKKWDTHKAKKEQMEEIAKRYLNGESLEDLAHEFGHNHPNLHKLLKYRCGTSWQIEFKCEDLKIDEKVELTIPRLLPDATIKAIWARASANKTYHHGEIKRKYLLSRMIFCKHCGVTMFGQANHGERIYYRHSHRKYDKRCELAKGWIKAEEIDDLVMRHLFECFGNPLAIQKAVNNATPNLEKIQQDHKRMKQLEDTLARNAQGRQRILGMISRNVIDDQQAEAELKTLADSDQKLNEEKQRIADNLAHYPDPKSIKDLSQKIATQFRQHQMRVSTAKRLAAQKTYDQMTYEEKRQLAEMVFGGKTYDGKRMGVYIEWTKDGWRFDIRGHLINEEGLIALCESKRKTFFDDHSDAQKQKGLLTKSASY